MTKSSTQLQLTFIKAEKGDKVFLSAPEPAEGTTRAGGNGFGLIRDAQMERYLQSIVSRLMLHWHGPKPERVGVFIEAGESVQGKATPSGDILIPIGAFDQFQSEDELAGLIAHELGHIVLKHHDDERQARELAKLANTAVEIAIIVSGARNSKVSRYGRTWSVSLANQGAFQRDALQAELIRQAVITITQDVILAAYSREQEYEADAFGVTLMGRAGWEPRTYLNLVQRWHDAQEAAREEKRRLAQQAGLMQNIMAGVGELAGAIIASHPSAEDRRNNASDVIRVGFAGAPIGAAVDQPFRAANDRPDFANKRKIWRQVNQASAYVRAGKIEEALHLLRGIQHAPAARHPDSRLVMVLAFEAGGTPEMTEIAYALLSSADLSQPATLTFYETAMERHSWRQNFTAVETVTEIAERHYGPRMLPAKLVAQNTRQKIMPLPPQQFREQISKLMAKCEATKDDELIGFCRDARDGITNDTQYEVCGGVLSGLASMTGGAKCTPATAANASQGGISSVLNGGVDGIGRTMGGLFRAGP